MPPVSGDGSVDVRTRLDHRQSRSGRQAHGPDAEKRQGWMHYHFEGRLTAHDCKRHLAHPFAVPAGSAQVDIDFRFAPDARAGRAATC